MQAVLPAAARNVLKAGEQLATGEVATRRGDAVVEDIGVAQILLQFGGFANAELIQQYDVRNYSAKQILRTLTETVPLTNRQCAK